ncbi:hypothetical protein ColTof4_00083 [Colletotrichum tofieldiae]|nr:hypothetical protein ColTof4_00083 [Colletotrichum tofieldiae]
MDTEKVTEQPRVCNGEVDERWRTLPFAPGNGTLASQPKMHAGLPAVLAPRTVELPRRVG